MKIVYGFHRFWPSVSTIFGFLKIIFIYILQINPNNNPDNWKTSCGRSNAVTTYKESEITVIVLIL